MLAKEIYKELYHDDAKTLKEIWLLKNLLCGKEPKNIDNVVEDDHNNSKLVKMLEHMDNMVINLSNILCYQYVLHENVVKAIIDGKFDERHDDSKESSIIGFKVYNSDKVIIHEGHHRIAAMLLKGEEKVEMKIFEAPQTFFKKWQINTCVMMLARDEDLFLNEWIDYHLSLGFDKIFIIDNNDIGKELKINNEHVEIIPFNGINFGEKYINKQIDAYNLGLKYIKNQNFNYVAVIDADEFIDIKECDNIKTFIVDNLICKNKNIAEIVWETYDDNDIIYEKDCLPKVTETYTRQQTKMKHYDWLNNESSWSKCIVKIYDGLKFDNSDIGSNAHWPAHECFKSGFYVTNHISPNNAVVRHYRTKCLETFFKHKVKNCNITKVDYGRNLYQAYFSINIETVDKLKTFLEFVKKYNLSIDEDFIDKRIKKLNGE